MKKLQLPYGVQEYLPEECYNKNLIEQKLSGLFYNSGFERVETPTIEYFDLFDDVIKKESINKMFKMTDNDGSLLVLRPDTTIQICRMAATKLDTSSVNKLFYIADSFEYLSNNFSSRNREFAQVGVEILGSSGVEGNIEAIVLAIEGLLACGLNDFLIDIGHLCYFKGLLSESGLTPGESDLLRSYINNKDSLAIELFLRNTVLSDEIKNVLTHLPSLFGDFKIIDKAKLLCNNDLSLGALDELKKTYDGIKAAGYEKYISIDLGLLQGDYYSGLVFKGMAKDVGLTILDGGRYDNLGGVFNAEMEAVGFAIGIKRLLTALDNLNELKPLPPCDICYIALKDYSEYEHSVINSIKSGGKRVIKIFVKTKDELQKFCRAKKISKALIIDGNKTEEIEV